MKIIWFLIVLILMGSPTEAQPADFAAFLWVPDGSGTLAMTRSQITLYDLSWQPIPIRSMQDGRPSVFSPDGHVLLVHEDGTWALWDIPTLQTVRELPIDPRANSAGWNRDGTEIFFQDEGQRSYSVYDSMTGTLLRQYSGGVWSSALDMRWSPDRNLVAFNALDQIILMDPDSGLEVRRLRVLEDIHQSIAAFSWSHDSQQLALIISRPAPPESDQLFYDDLVVLDVASGDLTVLLEDMTDDTAVSYVFWSKNDKEIAAISQSEIVVTESQPQGFARRFVKPRRIMASIPQYTPYGGQIRLSYLNLFDNQISALSDLVQTVVPIATLDRFAEIAVVCDAPDTLTNFDTDLTDVAAIAAQAQALLTAINALPEGAIPLSCAADLHAIAEAIIAQVSK